MPREFKTIGKRPKYTFIPAEIRQEVVRGGQKQIEYRPRESVVITDRPTIVPDDIADELVGSKNHGRYFVEITGAQEAAEAAADDLGLEEEIDDADLQEVPSVSDTGEAVAYLTQHGVSAENLQDKNGRAHPGKISAAARDIGVKFPNYG